MRQYRLPVIRSDGETNPTRDLARAWSRVLDRVTEPAERLRAALALARTLTGADRTIVFDGETVVAALPDDATSVAARRVLQRARRVLEDERVERDLFVARIAPDRPERIAIRVRAMRDEDVQIARAIVATCAWALQRGGGARTPANLPDGGATLARLEQLVHDARRMQRRFAVVYVDAEGAASGVTRDELARTLRARVRANDHLGHLGGDAYVALVALASGESEAYPAAQRLLDAAGAGDACASVGVAICPDDGELPSDLVEKAGAAAMAAASAGGARPYWFRESAGHEFGERAAIRRMLHDDPDSLVELRLEPIVDARTGAPRALRAVAAWREQVRMAVPPAAYAACDADGRARASLDRWVVTAAAAAHRAWRSDGVPAGLALCLAPADATADVLAGAFGATGLSGAIIEIDEDRAAAEDVASFVRRVRALGARCAIRAAYAAAAAERVHADAVTVDARHDVATLADLALASVLAPEVLVNGVETPERARWLARHGATALSGQGLAAPLRLRELQRWANDPRSSLGR